MTKGRLEAFSDGVIAILITIMVLELRVPEGVDLEALRAVVPRLLTYVLSFVFLGIYWNNHHHMFHLVTRVTGRILWANLHLLFWLSLVPFTTAWMEEGQFAPLPTAAYGAVLLLSAISWLILQDSILRAHGPQSALAAALGVDLKGKISFLLYLASIPLAFVEPWISGAIYVGVALMWLVPDRRFEAHAQQHT